MAKINVEFDTKDKVLSVVMDGKVFDNVSSVEFYSGFENDGFHGSVTTVEKVDNDDMIKVMRISAHDQEFKIEESSKASEIPNLHKLLANKLFPARLV